MQAVVLEEPRVLRVSGFPEPAAGEGQALVRLRASGICGSDLSAYRGTSPNVSYPRVIGHELLVDVLEAPERPDVVGKRAVVEPLLPCGVCRACRLGRYNCCTCLRVLGVHVDGGMSELASVGTSHIYPVPDKVPDNTAVLAEPTSIAYRAVQRSGIEAGRVAVVFGAGTIGLLIASLLIHARGCRVMIIDVDPWRLSVAESIGAVPLSGERGRLTQAVTQETDGEMADVVFEATGNPTCTRTTTDLVAYAGRIVLIGWNRGPVEVDTVTLMQKEVDLLGSRNSTNAFPAVLRLLESRAVRPEELITHHFGLSDAGDALELLDRGRDRALKIVIEGTS